MRLSKNTILITGGSSGIGLELAKQLSAMDNVIIITGRDQIKLDRVKKDFPNIHTYRSDVNFPEDVVLLYSKVTKEFPELNILINNAGVMKVFNFNNNNDDLNNLTNEITTNLNGPIWMTQKFIPHLKKQKNAAIVNVTSVVGMIPLPISPVYSATKAGLRSFTMSLREQLKHTSIKVFDLAPPATETNMAAVFDKKDTDEIGLMSVEKVVKITIKGMQNDCYEIRPGQSNQVYYTSKFAPRFILKLMSKSLDRMLEVDSSTKR